MIKKSIWAALLIMFAFVASAAELIAFNMDIPLSEIEKTDLYAAAKDGDAASQFKLATYFDMQEEKDNIRILSLLRKSAAQEYLESEYALGHVYHYGKLDIVPNAMEAEKWYMRAADKGDMEALRELQLLRKTPAYKLDSAPDIDEKWDIEWYRKTAGQGDTESQYYLGTLYLNGKKVERDYKKALAWFYQAANKGHLEAMCALGKMYLEGNGTPKKEDQGLLWYEKAANQDFIPAQQQLSTIYMEIETPNPEAAYKWLYLSLAYMFPDAYDLTKVSPTLAELESQMTSEQKLNAYRETDIFLRKHRPSYVERK